MGSFCLNELFEAPFQIQSRLRKQDSAHHTSRRPGTDFIYWPSFGGRGPSTPPGSGAGQHCCWRISSLPRLMALGRKDENSEHASGPEADGTPSPCCLLTGSTPSQGFPPTGFSAGFCQVPPRSLKRSVGRPDRSMRLRSELATLTRARL